MRYWTKIQYSEETKMVKTEVSKKMEQLEKDIDSKKAELKALEQKYTFSGVYKSVAGRENILRNLRDNETMTEVEKFEKSIELLETYVTSLKDVEEEN